MWTGFSVSTRSSLTSVPKCRPSRSSTTAVVVVAAPAAAAAVGARWRRRSIWPPSQESTSRGRSRPAAEKLLSSVSPFIYLPTFHLHPVASFSGEFSGLSSRNLHCKPSHCDTFTYSFTCGFLNENRSRCLPPPPPLPPAKWRLLHFLSPLSADICDLLTNLIR